MNGKEVATKEQCIRLFEELKLDLERALDTGKASGMTGAAYIITIQGVPVTPKIENNKIIPEIIEVGMPHTVQRFNYNEIQGLADYNQMYGAVKAQHWVTATMHKLHEIQSLITFFKQ